jgi:hypothetical protein
MTNPSSICIHLQWLPQQLKINFTNWCVKEEFLWLCSEITGKVAIRNKTHMWECGFEIA